MSSQEWTTGATVCWTRVNSASRSARGGRCLLDLEGRLERWFGVLGRVKGLRWIAVDKLFPVFEGNEGVDKCFVLNVETLVDAVKLGRWRLVAVYSAAWNSLE